MQSRLSQGQRQADRDTLHMVTSFQRVLQKHREVLDSKYHTEADSLRNQVAMFASSSDDRTRALVQEISVITSERNQAKQELGQYRKELLSVQAAAKLQVEQTSSSLSALRGDLERQLAEYFQKIELLMLSHEREKEALLQAVASSSGGCQNCPILLQKIAELNADIARL